MSRGMFPPDRARTTSRSKERLARLERKLAKPADPPRFHLYFGHPYAVYGSLLTSSPWPAVEDVRLTRVILRLGAAAPSGDVIATVYIGGAVAAYCTVLEGEVLGDVSFGPSSVPKGSTVVVALTGNVATGGFGGIIVGTSPGPEVITSGGLTFEVVGS